MPETAYPVDNVLTRCGSCAFWREGQDHRSGTCHRYAPRPAVARPSERGCIDTYWPPTLDDDGCADGQPHR